MKLTEKQKVALKKEKEHVLALCETGQWEEAYETYCKSSFAVDHYKADFDRFVDRFKFSLKQKKGGWKFSLMYYLSGYLMITFGFAVIALTLRGMLSPYGDPMHATIIPAIIVSMAITWGLYQFRNYLVR